MKKIFVAFLLSVTAMADHDPEISGVYLGMLSHGGSGCPQGSVSALLNADSQSIVFQLSDYIVEAYGKNQVGRKNCAIALPIHLPPGIQATLVSTRYHGYNDLSKGTTATLSSEVFFTGGKGVLAQKTFKGPLDREFNVEFIEPVINSATSGCGGSTIMRLNSSLTVRTGSKGGYALSTIQEVEPFENTIVYVLSFKRCR